ncbi:EscE/YscE/SsaE family type III secretion system needle protein co-chaperone [Candidatus Pelagibacter sp.]|nr:EscE/YscE/SsaE family type III secretion system needle protein co-chaperone [Candidatus Pelagibacter sp.]
MKDKDLPIDNSEPSLEELTEQASKIIASLESEKDLGNSAQRYQELLKLNKAIESKFHKNFKNISEETSNKVKEIKKK